MPLASQLTAMRPQTGGAATAGRSQSPNLIVPGTVAVLVVLAVAWFLTRRARQGLEVEHPADRGSKKPGTSDRAWNEPHPLDPHDDVERGGSSGMETRRTGMIRTVEFDLKTLLQTTIEQLRENGWEATAVCPSVQLSGDPIRLQRVLTAAVGTAKLRGADRVGLAVEVVEGGVLLTIGDDATVEPEEATEFADRLAGQVGAALGRKDVGVSWMSDEEVTLFTASLSANVHAQSESIEQAQVSTDVPLRDAGEGVTTSEEDQQHSRIGTSGT